GIDGEKMSLDRAVIEIHRTAGGLEGDRAGFRVGIDDGIVEVEIARGFEKSVKIADQRAGIERQGAAHGIERESVRAEGRTVEAEIAFGLNGQIAESTDGGAVF